jgi:hypothetical protein
MKRLRTLSRMALHELFISFQWIAIVGLPVLGGMVVIAVPPELSGVTAVGGAALWYAVAASVAISVATGLAAATMAHERRRGTVAWMAVRAVPRSAVLLSWFVAFGVLLTTGLALGSIGAWFAAISRADSPPDFVPFMAAIGATAGAGLACVAVGLLIGTYLRTRPAMLLAFALGAIILTASLAVAPGQQLLPTGGIGILSHLEGAARPIGDSMRSAGAALAAAAVLLILAGVGLERSDL